MCEALDAVRARRAAADKLGQACLQHLQPWARPFSAPLAEPLPVGMTELLRRINGGIA